jgi:glycerol-3-phosphate dehydrogenase
MSVDLTRDDIVGTYVGLRPLVAGPGTTDPATTVKQSREHQVTTESNGLVRIGGGKYTTYRVMAADVVSAALGRDGARARPSATAELPLVGAAPREELDRLARALGPEWDLDAVTVRSLVARHGTEAEDVLAYGRAFGGLRPLGPAIEQLEVEVSWAARRELARSIDDVLSRRMRLTQVLPDRGASAAPRVAELLGAELGWDAARQAREVAAFVERAGFEYGVPPADG